MSVRVMCAKACVDVDDDGYPVIFRQHLASYGKNSAPSEDMLSTCHSELSMCNSDTTQLYDEPPDEPVFDDHGFPVFDAGAAVDAGAAAFVEKTPPSMPAAPIVDPRPRARKQQTLTKRTCAKAKGPVKQTSTKGQDSSVGETKRVDSLWDPRLSGPTKEPNPRCEVVAKQLVCGRPKRVHVFTLTKNGFGDAYHDVAKRVYEAIKKGGVDKQAAIQMREAARSS